MAHRRTLKAARLPDVAFYPLDVGPFAAPRCGRLECGGRLKHAMIVERPGDDLHARRHAVGGMAGGHAHHRALAHQIEAMGQHPADIGLNAALTR